MIKPLLAFICILSICSCNNSNQQNSGVNDSAATPDATLSPAIINMQQQLQQFPDSAGLRLSLALAFDSIKAYTQANAQMDTLVAKDSTNYGLWFSKAQLLEDSGDTLNAMESYAKAAAIYPSPDAILGLANLYAEQKNERCLLLCKQVKDMSLGREYDAHCAFITGVYNARTNNPTEAVYFFNQCIKDNYTYMPAYIEKGLVYFDHQQYREALNVFQFASTIDNLYADAYYYMARCYEMLQVTDSAVLRYQQALNLDKTMHEAQQGLARLHAQ